MKVVMIGLGYVGVTALACISSQGHHVVGIDTNEQKVDTVNAGRAPIIEPGVAELIADGLRAGLLSASTTIPPLNDNDVVIVCVGTPSTVDGSHNMGHIAESARQIAHAAQTVRGRITVAFRSTFRPGTTEDLIAPIFAEVLGENFTNQVELVYNPEFLRESTAVADYFDPPKIVIGTQDGRRSEAMIALHEGIVARVFEVGFREAEITKFIDNSWHAAKVAFANEVGRVCAAYGVDSAIAHSIFVADTKLNISAYYTRPGGAFGGSCLPKDVRAMQSIARTANVKVELLDSLLRSNDSHKDFQLARVEQSAEPGAKILIVGLAFKAGTDDMRESPHVTLVAQLLERGYKVRILDPAVRTSALIGQNLGYTMSQLPTLRELLISAEEIAAATFDLVVRNSDAEPELQLQAGTPVLDLRSIS